MPAPSDEQIGIILETAETLKIDGKYEQAIALLEEILTFFPDNVMALEEIADSELSLEHLERAAVAAKRAVALDSGSYTGHYVLGFIASQREEWGRAIQHLQIANHLKSNNPEILRCLGWALFEIGERVQGIVTIERALNLDPLSVLTLCDLGFAYVECQNLPKARSLFERALDIDQASVRALECLEMVRRLEKQSKLVMGKRKK